MTARPPQRIGAVAGMASEALLIRERCPGVLVAVTGARPPEAKAAALRLLDDGVEALLSFGVAGGLDPALKPGTLLLSERVLVDGTAIPVDTVWRDRWAAMMPSALGGTLLSVDGAVESPVIKERLHSETGAIAIDMESGWVARVARDRKVPFLVARAVADRASDAVPNYALDALDSAGKPRVGVVLWGLIRQPWTLPNLLSLGRGSVLAHRALLTAVEATMADPD